jgi:hypothetical protein
MLGFGGDCVGGVDKSGSMSSSRPWVCLAGSRFVSLQGYTNTQAVIGSTILLLLCVVVVVVLIRMWLSRH